MLRLGLLVGEENWSFFRDISDDLAAHYTTQVYSPRQVRVPLLSGTLNSRIRRRRIRSVLRQNEVCLFEWASDLLMTASQMREDTALVARLHSFELLEWAPKIDWEAVTRVIFVSEAMRRLFLARHCVPPENTVVVTNGVDLRRFKPALRPHTGVNLGMLCSITPIKRVYEAVLTQYELRLAGYPTHLHIGGEPGGDPRYEAAILHLVERLDLRNSVTLHGRVVDAASWLQGIDIFVSNSYWEGLQVALIEAMAAGCYCLSHVWLGAEDVLPPENLFRSEAELAQRIKEYIERPEGERAQRRAVLRSIACDKFDLERTKRGIREELENAYRSRRA